VKRRLRCGRAIALGNNRGIAEYPTPLPVQPSDAADYRGRSLLAIPFG
jgi:hypothetical protein